MIAIIIIYLLGLIPAIYFTKYGLENYKFPMPKFLVFLSVWIITPGYLALLIYHGIKKLITK